MAQVIQQEDLGKNKNNEPGQNSSLNTPQGPTGPSSGQNQVNSQGPAQPGAITSYNPNKQAGSGYTNIQRIVQANQNNRLGQAVGGGIQQQANQTRQDIGQAQNQFQQQTQQNRADTTQNQQLVQNVLANPEQAAGNQSSQFQRLLSGVYQGPQGLQNAQQLQAQAQDVNQLGQAIGSQGGQMGLLQRFVGNPQYQAGQQRLDALLLGQTGAPQLAQARKAALGLQAQTGSAITGAQQQAQELAGKAQAFGQAAQNQFGQTVSGIESGLLNKANQAQQERDAQVKQIQDQFARGELTPEQAQQLGIQSGALSYGIDPNQFLNVSPIKATEQNVASAQDFARLNALKQLSGQYAPEQAQQILGKFAGQESQAGTLGTTKAAELNLPEFQNAYQAAQTQYNQTLEQPKAHLDEANKILDVYRKYGLTTDNPQNVYGGNFLPNYQLAQQEIQKFAPGAFGGSPGENIQWAMNNLANRQNQFNQTMDTLNQAYGTGTFTVPPSGQS